MLTPLPVQTTYTQFMAAAQLGMPGSTTKYNIDTRLMDDPSGNGVGFGLAVSQGTLHGDKSVAIGLASGGSFIGITCADPTIYNGSPHVDTYGDGDNTAVLTFGDLWVAPTTTNVVSGHPVYFNSATGALGDSSISNATLIANAHWIDSKPNTDQPLVPFAGLARVRLGSMA